MEKNILVEEKSGLKDENKILKNLKKLKNQSSATIGFILLFCLMSILSDSFLDKDNIMNIARQMSINAIISVGMTFIIITGGIDLSLGSVMALTGTSLAALVSIFDVPIFLAIIIVLVGGTILGGIKGYIITTQDLPPFIVTLAMLTIISGLSFLMTGGRPISVNTDAYKFIGRGYLGLFPIPVLIMIVLVIFGGVMLGKTSFGRHVYAVGGNSEAARLCGIKNSRVIVKVYALAGLLTGISGVILSSRLASGSPTVGVGAELDAIASVVLGGASFSGGVGTITGTFFGVMIMSVLSNGMNLLNISSYNQMIIKGLVILMAIWINNLNIKNVKK